MLSFRHGHFEPFQFLGGSLALLLGVVAAYSESWIPTVVLAGGVFVAVRVAPHLSRRALLVASALPTVAAVLLLLVGRLDDMPSRGGPRNGLTLHARSPPLPSPSGVPCYGRNGARHVPLATSDGRQGLEPALGIGRSDRRCPVFCLARSRSERQESLPKDESDGPNRATRDNAESIVRLRRVKAPCRPACPRERALRNQSEPSSRVFVHRRRSPVSMRASNPGISTRLQDKSSRTSACAGSASEARWRAGARGLGRHAGRGRATQEGLVRGPLERRLRCRPEPDLCGGRVAASAAGLE